MELQEAIQNLMEEADFEKDQHNLIMVDSIELGIEALKWRQESEQYDSSLKAFPLLGETKE